MNGRYRPLGISPYKKVKNTTLIKEMMVERGIRLKKESSFSLTFFNPRNKYHYEYCFSEYNRLIIYEDKRSDPLFIIPLLDNYEYLRTTLDNLMD